MGINNSWCRSSFIFHNAKFIPAPSVDFLNAHTLHSSPSLQTRGWLPGREETTCPVGHWPEHKLLYCTENICFVNGEVNLWKHPQKGCTTRELGTDWCTASNSEPRTCVACSRFYLCSVGVFSVHTSSGTKWGGCEEIPTLFSLWLRCRDVWFIFSPLAGLDAVLES